MIFITTNPPTCDENTLHAGGFVFRFTDAASIQLGSRRNMVVDHQQMEIFLAVFLVDGADDHATAVDAHHFAWWQVGDGDQGFADEFLWFVVVVDAGEDGSVFA